MDVNLSITEIRPRQSQVFSSLLAQLLGGGKPNHKLTLRLREIQEMSRSMAGYSRLTGTCWQMSYGTATRGNTKILS
jgi:hypothetical protein